MNKIFYSFGLLALLSVTTLSCSKNSGDDDDEDECGISVANLIGSYRLSSVVRVNGNITTNVINELYDPCEQDDVTELKANYQVVLTDMGVKCTPDGSVSGVWGLSGTTLMIDSGTAEIVHFDCNGFSVEYPEGGTTIREAYRKI